MICIGANDSYGHYLPLSSVGRNIHCLAPGENIAGPVTHTCNCLENVFQTQLRRQSPNQPSYTTATKCACPVAHTQAIQCKTGTSYAAPAVAGLISLLIQFAKERCNMDTLHIQVVRKILQEMTMKHFNVKEGYGPLYPLDYMKGLKPCALKKLAEEVLSPATLAQARLYTPAPAKQQSIAAAPKHSLPSSHPPPPSPPTLKDTNI